MIAAQEGHGPSMPAMLAGTRNCTPQLGQLKERRSWLTDIPEAQVKEQNCA